MELATEKQMEEIFQLADRVNRISVSPTMVVLQEAEQLKAQGVDVVDFGPGEPDFPTPEHIKRAVVKALEENRTKYTPVAGIAPLRQAICDWHAAQSGIVLSAGRVRRQRRRQARHLQCRLLADQSGRRSHYRRALLGQLSGHGEVCRRNARLRRRRARTIPSSCALPKWKRQSRRKPKSSSSIRRTIPPAR